MRSTTRRSVLAAAVATAALAVAAYFVTGLGRPAIPAVGHWPPSAGGPGIEVATRFGPAGPTIPFKGDGHGDLLQDAQVPIALLGTTAYVREPESLLVVDTGSGRTLARVPAPWPTPALGADDVTPRRIDQSPPVITTLNGRQTVVAGWLAEIREPGSAKLSPVVELAAVDTATDRVEQRWKANLPAWVDLGNAEEGVRVAGVVGTTAVVSFHGNDTKAHETYHAETFGVDLTSGRLLWSRAEFDGSVLTRDNLVGAQLSPSGDSVVAVDPASGRTRWARPRTGTVHVESAGPDFVVADENHLEGTERFGVLDPATGHTVTQLPTPGPQGGFQCRYDAASISVCIVKSRLLAVDTHTGGLLWQGAVGYQSLPTMVTAVWHGRIYGNDSSDTLGMWEARTGRLLGSQLPIEPSLLDGQVAVALVDGSDGAIHARQVLG